MFGFGSKKIYENVFEIRTEEVGSLRVKVTFVNGESCYLTIEGHISPLIRESNPLNNIYYTTSYTITSAREVFHEFIDNNNSNYIVSEDDDYYNLEVNAIRKIEVSEIPKQKEIKIYVGTHEVGKDDE